MLGRTLLAGIDTVISLHDTVDAGLDDGGLIVEVVKDRVGASLGCWVVWAKSETSSQLLAFNFLG